MIHNKYFKETEIVLLKNKCREEEFIDLNKKIDELNKYIKSLEIYCEILEYRNTMYFEYLFE